VKEKIFHEATKNLILSNKNIMAVLNALKGKSRPLIARIKSCCAQRSLNLHNNINLREEIVDR
jgi:hypothetical protein